jgi:hypothetical protein
MPPTSPSRSSISPMCSPARIWRSIPVSYLRFEVVQLGGGVGLDLGPCAAGTGRGFIDLLPGVLGGQVHVHPGLVDTLAQLLTGLRHS